ncbi:purine-binding chemotaxis protein CheW [Malonomonas rubra DSM 5091]|uniref:Purine-binding chemotaxis protein CheW n=1 Tax=Malonomonas rubra DSM 5091 TaxID=1122189 RepID=A0A1M6DF92_MALRU|nr:chemotaxis protein CheW [Malonomonas rubra]SHI71994.1 purine-binding chemotaxis protein CheW [Malonomonas rubra DSM 5091]
MNDFATDTAERAVKPIKVACLRVGQQFYALDIMCIKEIIRTLPIVAVPKAPAYVDGVINLRKAVIPVVDLRRRFGLPALAEKEKKQRIVICAIDGRIVGLLADEVTEVVACSPADVRPTPYYLSGPEAEFFPGVCRKGDQLMMLLDPRKLLAFEATIDMSQLESGTLVAGD